MKVLALTALLAVSFLNLKAEILDNLSNQLIYGNDNRKEAYHYFDKRFVKKSASVLIRIPKDKITEDQSDNQILNFEKKMLMEVVDGLCVDERFSNQYSLGDCSAVLIAKNKILTAGHCVFGPYECQNYVWAFDFTNDKEFLNKKDVYSCKNIEVQKYEYSEEKIKDYAIIELDRETDRIPVNFRKYGQINYGTPLVVIGHPLGLSMKIADHASVKLPNKKESKTLFESLKLRKYYFTTNTDTYTGNSGSPVFNRITGKLEGIVIQGADDFDYNEKKECLQSHHNSNSFRSSYEKILRINEIEELKNY